ncbi:hypothetical protein GCM10009836_08880 [Pseudonocardia ailaonensis]|uniref:PE-PGRS family protein n=1 Tax=Pseudonocardia ailaonensis TaxID=367279 RepID=A0ABN2MPG2_9PSEU
MALGELRDRLLVGGDARRETLRLGARQAGLGLRAHRLGQQLLPGAPGRRADVRGAAGGPQGMAPAEQGGVEVVAAGVALAGGTLGVPPQAGEHRAAVPGEVRLGLQVRGGDQEGIEVGGGTGAAGGVERGPQRGGLRVLAVGEIGGAGEGVIAFGEGLTGVEEAATDAVGLVRVRGGAGGPERDPPLARLLAARAGTGGGALRGAELLLGGGEVGAGPRQLGHPVRGGDHPVRQRIRLPHGPLHREGSPGKRGTVVALVGRRQSGREPVDVRPFPCRIGGGRVGRGLRYSRRGGSRGRRGPGDRIRAGQAAAVSVGPGDGCGGCEAGSRIGRRRSGGRGAVVAGCGDNGPVVSPHPRRVWRETLARRSFSSGRGGPALDRGEEGVDRLVAGAARRGEGGRVRGGTQRFESGEGLLSGVVAAAGSVSLSAGLALGLGGLPQRRAEGGDPRRGGRGRYEVRGHPGLRPVRDPGRTGTVAAGGRAPGRRSARARTGGTRPGRPNARRSPPAALAVRPAGRALPRR